MAKSSFWPPMVGLCSALFLSACAGGSSGGFGAPPPEPAVAPPAPPPEIPASIRPSEIVGRWGYASYQRPQDRARTEAAARGQCSNPFVIGQGPNGGVMMLQADSPEMKELRLRGGPGGKNYIGPAGAPAGGMQDREVEYFDGRVMVLRYVDPEVNSRYGTGIFVRCAPRA